MGFNLYCSQPPGGDQDILASLLTTLFGGVMISIFSYSLCNTQTHTHTRYRPGAASQQTDRGWTHTEDNIVPAESPGSRAGGRGEEGIDPQQSTGSVVKR